MNLYHSHGRTTKKSEWSERQDLNQEQPCFDVRDKVIIRPSLFTIFALLPIPLANVLDAVEPDLLSGNVRRFSAFRVHLRHQPQVIRPAFDACNVKLAERTASGRLARSVIFLPLKPALSIHFSFQLSSAREVVRLLHRAAFQILPQRPVRLDARPRPPAPLQTRQRPAQILQSKFLNDQFLPVRNQAVFMDQENESLSVPL